MSDLFGNYKDQFSCITAQLLVLELDLSLDLNMHTLFGLVFNQ